MLDFPSQKPCAFGSSAIHPSACHRHNACCVISLSVVNTNCIPKEPKQNGDCLSTTSTCEGFTITIMTTRNKLLNHLQSKPGKWISGETLSRHLAVSRSAINKHIKKLRQDGYQIESVTRKGYRLEETHNLITVEGIQTNLGTQIFGRKTLAVLKAIDSTNQQAKQMAAQGEPEGTVVVAESQHSGRGRKGREWISPPGSGIYASLILRPQIPPSDAPGITLMTAVAVAESLMAISDAPFRIKWPNDILVNGKKIAGILTEISTEMDSVDYIVVGIGINVNTRISNFPQQLRGRVTSLFTETGQLFPVMAVLQNLLRRFETWYLRFQQDGFGQIRDRWKSLSEIIGKDVVIQKVGENVQGRIIDIDHGGVLLLQDRQERIHRIFSGDLIL